MQNALIIPWRDMAPDTLECLITDIVTRDGTDYGAVEVTLETKIAQVKRKLETHQACLVFDADTGTCGVLGKDERRIRDLL